MPLIHLGLVAVLLAASPVPAVSEKGPQTAVQKAIDAASCTGEYADAILALSARSREFEQLADANYSYCLRNTATYECLAYGLDGKIRRRAVSVVTHGTAFAYREKAEESYLLTNEHLANWPAVTSEDKEVKGVPPGCKKIDEQLRLVRDESDDYEPGQITVTKVAADPALDAAIVKSRQKLNLMPYRIGRSALLRSGNVVAVRGFPLGLLQATNFGKVVTAYDADREKGWDHVDFITDALLARGNSGSPVFAVSCRTGELELVGLYHAGYRESPALNAAVGIDQLREFMETFKRSKSAHPEEAPPSAEVRAQAVQALGRPETTPYFRVGDRVVRARLDGPSVVFEFFQESFPVLGGVALVLRDGPGAGAGALESLGVDGPSGMRRASPETTEAETQERARKLLDLTRRQLVRTLAYREAAAQARSSRDASRRAGELLKQLDRTKADANDLIRSLLEAGPRLPVAVPAPAKPTTKPTSSQEG